MIKQNQHLSSAVPFDSRAYPLCPRPAMVVLIAFVAYT